MEKPKYYITTAIAYTSGTPHIGNVYEIVLTDFLARFKRKQGYDVRFQTGTDEHGEKIEQKAASAGVAPKAFVDKVAGDIRETARGRQVSGLRQRSQNGGGGSLFLPYEQICGQAYRVL